MQFDQVILWIKANPAPAAIALGGYLLVGLLVLWSICRRSEGSFSTTAIARAILTALFALPIWPIVWLIWILHFRKFAPDAIDLTRYRLPVIDLAEHRADDIRFAPKNVVVDAEIVESPGGKSESASAQSKPSASKYKAAPLSDKKPKPITTPVSSVAAANRKSEPLKPSPGAVPKPEPHPSPPPSDKEKPAASPPVDSPGTPKPPSAASPGSEAPKKPSAPPPSVVPKPPAPSAPAAPKVHRPPTPSAPPAPPASAAKSAPAVAPKWPSVAVDPRTPEPPSAPPFVKKMERVGSEGPGEKSAPAPFPSPSEKSPESEVPPAQKTAPDLSKKPDVPEIPIR